jgi:hypothetical protein
MSITIMKKGIAVTLAVAALSAAVYTKELTQLYHMI